MQGRIIRADSLYGPLAEVVQVIGSRGPHVPRGAQRRWRPASFSTASTSSTTFGQGVGGTSTTGYGRHSDYTTLSAACGKGQSMARRRPRPCLGHRNRCPNLTTDPSGRCEKCRRAYDSERNKARDAIRPSPAERGYDSEHRKLREQWAPVVAAGGVRCAHPGCHRKVASRQGSVWWGRQTHLAGAVGLGPEWLEKLREQLATAAELMCSCIAPQAGHGGHD